MFFYRLYNYAFIKFNYFFDFYFLIYNLLFINSCLVYFSFNYVILRFL